MKELVNKLKWLEKKDLQMRTICILKSLATPISPTTTNAEGRDNHFQFVEERGTWFPN